MKAKRIILLVFVSILLSISIIAGEIYDSNIEFVELKDRSQIALEPRTSVKEMTNFPKFSSVDVENGYIIDFSNADFKGSLVELDSLGNNVYYCTNFDVDRGNCDGKWKRLIDVEVGEEYEFISAVNDVAIIEVVDKDVERIKPEIGLRDSRGTYVNMGLDIINKWNKSDFNASSIVPGYYDAELTIEDSPVQTIEFNKLKVDEAVDLGIDDVPEDGEFAEYAEVYAIDPTKLDFENATVTAVAKGNELWKCKDWNFTSQRCFGTWVKLMDITPGQEYTFTLTPNDPGFAEIIVITRAEHLDENKAFVSNIYEQVKEQDGVWSETIPAGHYIRVSFEQNLTSSNDITLYPRIISGTPRIEVYEKDGTELIAEFASINDDEYNKIYLTNLENPQDTFDLLVLDGSVEFDHIIDPFPEVINITTTVFSSAATAHNVRMPSTVDANDLLLVLFTNDGSATVTTPSGWTSISTLAQVTYGRGSVYAKIAVGNEDGTTVNFVTSASEEAAAQVYRIPSNKWYGNITTGVAAASGGGVTTGSSVNPPALNTSSWDVEDTLWIAYAAGSSWTSVSTWPTNYVNGNHVLSNTGTAGASASSARRELAAASDDPAAFSMSSTGSGVAFTIAIRPFANSPPTTPTSIKCNGGSCNNTFVGNVSINCSGSTDNENNTITYSIEAKLQNTSTSNNTVQVPSSCSNSVYASGAHEFYSKWTIPGSGSAVVTKFWFWQADTSLSNSETLEMALYNSSGSQISEEVTLTGTGASEWISGTLATPVNITLGNTYYIGVAPISATYNMGRDDGADCADYPPGTGSAYYSYYTTPSDNDLDSNVPTDNISSSSKYIIPGISYNYTDFVYIGNHTNGTIYNWNISGITPQSNVDLRCRAIDLVGSNTYSSYYSPGINLTITSDTTPPSSVTNLQNRSSGPTWLYWNWTNPTDADFNSSIIYINGANVANTSNNYYNATGLNQGTNYTITVRTKDTAGNINTTDVNNTAKTQSAGILNVTLLNPLTSQTTKIIQNQKFWVNATVYCDGTAGALCGNITAYARYNITTGGFPAGWWNQSFPYRKEINLTENSGSNLDGYQFNITLDTQSLISSGKMQSDCDDIRFANSSSELSYWIESGCNTTATLIWVNTSVAASGTKTIYIYYGNSSAAGASNAKNTLVIYEDMSTTPSGTLSGNASYDAGNQWVRLTTATASLAGALNYNINPGDGFVTEFEFWIGGGTGADATWLHSYVTSVPTSEDDAVGGYMFNYDEYTDQMQLKWNGISLSNYSQTNLDNSTWKYAKIVHSGTNSKMYLDNVLNIDYTDSSRTKTGTNFGWGARTGGSTNEHRIRNLKVRKYVSSQPTVAIGNEESSSPLSEGFAAINTTTGATPLYTTESQPQSCVLSAGQSCQLNWSVNATGTINTTYKINVNFSSSYSEVGQNQTNNATILIINVDTTNPVINSINDSPDPVNKSDNIIITANVTDEGGVNSVLVSINGTNYTMSRNEIGLLFEDYESGTFATNGWTNTGSGTNWYVSADDAYSPFYHAQANGTGTESILEKSMNLSGNENITISFYAKTSGLDTGEYIAASWYDGVTWNSLLAQTQTIASYTKYSYNLSSSANNNADFKIRFRCLSNAAGEFCRVDDVNISSKLSMVHTYNYNTSSLSAGLYNYTVYANDTSGRTAAPQTGSFNVTIPGDSTNPTWSNNQTNATSNTKTGESVYFNITLTDNTAGGYYTFSFYNGSSWQNDSAAAWTNGSQLQKIKIINAPRGQTVQWYWWFNDSSGNKNQTNTWSFTVANTIPTHTTPVLNSTLGSNLTTENLTVYNKSTSDADNDAVKNIINWKLNGSSITTLNMPFEGGSNSTFAKDYALGNNGTVSGATRNAAGGYDRKGAYEFDGIDDYIYGIPNSTINRDKGTIEVWAKPVKMNESQHIIWAGDSAGNGYGPNQELHLSAGHFLSNLSMNGFVFFYGDNEDDPAIATGDGTNRTYLFSGNLTAEQWYHVVVTWDFDDMTSKMYINGDLVDSDDLSGDELPYNTSAWQDDLYIGRPGTSQRYFNGTLDEVRIYNYALSPEQIKALYSNRTDVIVSQETSVGDEWQACITPNDGNQDGNTLCSNILTVLSEAEEEPAIMIEWIEPDDEIIFKRENEIITNEEENEDITWIDKIIGIWTVLT